MIIISVLIMVYTAFVSLGLPDGLGGTAWPLMYREFAVPLSFVSIAFLPSTFGAVLSSILAGKTVKKFGTGAMTAASCLLTGGALIGISFAFDIRILMLFAFPLGLGAGGVDAAMNDYVSRYFSARHMNWLHACYGIGAAAGPVIMTTVISVTGSWRWGERIVGIIQLSLAVVFLLSIGTWKKAADFIEKNRPVRQQVSCPVTGSDVANRKTARKQIIRLVISFAVYTGCEAVVVTWTASYFSIGRGLSPVLAGRYLSVFFAVFVIGRILAGLVVERLSLSGTVATGMIIAFSGTAVLLLFGAYTVPAFIGIGLIGLGFAPAYPCMMQQTPLLVGASDSPAVVGYQMAGANISYLIMPYLTGLICERTTMLLMPVMLILFITAFSLIKLVPEKPLHFLFDRQ